MSALIGILFMLIYLGIFVYVLMLQVRMTEAQEATARHLLEIARDIKILIVSRTEEGGAANPTNQHEA